MWSKCKASALLPASSLEFLQFLLTLHVVFTSHDIFTESLWYSQVTTSGLLILSWPFSLFLFWHSSLQEIICLVISSCQHELKAFEGIQYTRGTTSITISRILLSVWSVLQELCSQDPNQSESNEPKKAVNFLSQLPSSVTLGSWVSVSPEVLIQLQQVVLAIAQAAPRSARR